MRKTIILLFSMITFSSSLQAQDAVETVKDGLNFEELGQTATEFILNIQKLGFIKSTIKIVKASNIDLLAAYTTMKEIKEGEFKLHEKFKGEVLGIVKNEVINHSKVLQTWVILKDIREEAKAARDQISATDMFSAAEKEFFTKSYSNILREAGSITLEVTSIITDNELAMNDGERIKLVYMMHDSAATLLTGLRQFNNKMRMVANLRLENSDDYGNVKNLFITNVNN